MITVNQENLERFVIMTVIRNLPTLPVDEELKRPHQPKGCIRCGGEDSRIHYYRYFAPSKPVSASLSPISVLYPEIKEHGPLCSFCYHQLLGH